MSNRYRKSILERDPVKIGIVGTIIIIAITVLAFNYGSLPVVNGGKKYHAQFADASGLHTGDAVQIAGVEVGKVTDISINGTKVDVTFTADPGDLTLKSETTAQIKVETALGRRFIELVSAGRDPLPAGATIALERTSSGYDITRSLNEVTDTVAKTDKPDLSSALDQLTKLQDALPEDLRSTIDGVRRLSSTVAERDGDLRDLLNNAGTVTDIVAERNQQLVSLLGQGRTLFAALNTRATAIRRVLVQGSEVANALTAIASDNRATLRPALDQLNSVLDTLNANYQNIDRSLAGLERFARQVGEAVSSGPFFSAMLQNILPANLNGQQPYSPGAPR
ncbi:MCE family protein [Gordonia pseudamarae]|jgi:phospholipid/cholesterol/gamma-HCH transport system substrate-binding protein|uniref:MCE family protein n=1 Tax=Gordonia pseudamarae TaxID=2831662 RepID=A0ABX6ILE9_9ACTN|nr:MULTISPECIES: MCE family protein [Gordonia]MBD0020821.1 MCE family protein [Gordonia sp. (in: high G+C Gram-positive bacteria)]QHN27850.1 MCE family protein [Gordonia pseudamarae]QHN36732.1 MCE family protein [Gordonia pseudamarae]